MSERAEFHVMGQPLDGTPLHYTAAGLDYVYLLNGFTFEDDEDYGRIVTIENERNLHRAIGLYVITRPRPLTGTEFRFLRRQMEFKQKDLAAELGVNEQTVANYEKNKRIPTTSDHLMRMVFLLWITPADERVELMKRLDKAIKTQRTRKSCTAMPPSDIQTSIAKQWHVQAGIDRTSACHAC